MNGLLGNMVFLNPWILAALGVLPALWFLLRITPPAPKLIILPTTRFLEGLIAGRQTPRKTPWWILLLRLLIAALVIVALAHPVHNPAGGLPGNGALRLVISNDWAAAQNWDTQKQAALDIINQAERAKRILYIQTTTPAPGQNEPAAFGPLAASEAKEILKGLSPLPWPADYVAGAKQLKDNKPNEAVYSFWLAHGLADKGFESFMDILEAQGGLEYMQPATSTLPLLLKPPADPGYALEIAVDAVKSISPRPVSIQALDEDARVIDQQMATLDPAHLPQKVTFDVPEALRNTISQYRIAGQSGAGGTFLLDERFRKRSVGIAGPADEADIKPFIEAHYYLTRALEPYTTLYQDTIDKLLTHKPSVIILPDVGAMPVETLDAIEKWVRAGGLLLRFAGPNMTQGPQDNTLVPVPLRTGGRALDGSMTWEMPVTLAPFPEISPFYGISLHEDITVRRQILAQPTEDIEQKTWAALADGTPLITASMLDKGLLVMVHTTASPDWSDLALSGVFVEMLRRIVNMAGSAPGADAPTGGFLQPQIVLDGFGAVHTPDSSVRAIEAAALETTPPGPSHPPGIYGREGFQVALNLGDHIKDLRAATDFPAGVKARGYGQSYERDLMPGLLLAATMLLLLDWLAMIVLSIGWRLVARLASAVVLITAFPVHAEDYDEAIQYTDGLYLAYVQTGNPGLDATTRRGLENLNSVLERRTSIEPAGVAAVNPERDELAFFPLLYWTISDTQNPLSPEAAHNIQNYLDHGGTILFDTRDQNYAAGALSGTRNQQALRAITAALNIPPLEPAPKNHVLAKSFYLLNSFPGRYDGGMVWVETASVSGRDNVSSVIIGANDWASAWAEGDPARASFAGTSRQQEMALRFGVNLVMYALTGNYKADQVHVPHILERLGQ